MQDNIGTVYLVGAGPGDPELLTVKALRLIESAQVVVYDRLVSEEILTLIPAGVPRISAGKACGNHYMSQDEINDLLVSLGRTKRRVVRLKGGDPFVFGRGGEEAIYLKRHGVSFEVVPGITAASACSTYSGVPLTHRGMSRSVRLITGHFRHNEPIDLDWRSIANEDTTLVFYMGLGNLGRICAELMAAGLDTGTPALVVQDGTTNKQRRVFGQLDNLPERVSTAGLAAPSIIIIGKTVSLTDDLDWYNPVPAEAAHELDTTVSG